MRRKNICCPTLKIVSRETQIKKFRAPKIGAPIKVNRRLLQKRRISHIFTSLLKKRRLFKV
jgi:hypothetical protein